MTTCECREVNRDDAIYCAACGRRISKSPALEVAQRQTVDEAPTAVTKRNRRSIVGVVCGALAVALLVAATIALSSSHQANSRSSNRLVSVSLGLNICPTTNGGGEAAANLPSRVAIELPERLSSRLNLYSDNQGVLELLAPPGWNCTATIGANGSASLQIAPPSQPDVYSGALSSYSIVKEIGASETSACLGCGEIQACPLFYTAAHDYQRDYSQTCPTAAPYSEARTQVSRNIVEFIDPPGVSGDASPSGGAYPAMGVMTYYGEKNNDGSWTETCVLPPTTRSMCQAIIKNFVAKYGSY